MRNVGIMSIVGSMLVAGAAYAAPKAGEKGVGRKGDRPASHITGSSRAASEAGRIENAESMRRLQEGMTAGHGLDINAHGKHEGNGAEPLTARQNQEVRNKVAGEGAAVKLNELVSSVEEIRTSSDPAKLADEVNVRFEENFIGEEVPTWQNEAAVSGVKETVEVGREALASSGQEGFSPVEAFREGKRRTGREEPWKRMCCGDKSGVAKQFCLAM